MDVVWASLCFYDFYALLLAQLSQYNPYILFYGHRRYSHILFEGRADWYSTGWTVQQTKVVGIII